MKILYFQGLKGLAMLSVILMHLYLCFTPILEQYSDIIEKTPFVSWFFNGNLAVCVFLVISGFCVSNSFEKIDKSNLNLVRQKIIYRYVRFAVPLFLIGVLSYIFYLFGLMKIYELGILTDNVRLKIYYNNIPIIEVLKSLLYSPLGASGIIGPLWMLKFIFLGTLLCYILEILTNGVSIARILAISAFVCVGLRLCISQYYCCIVIGFVFSKLFSHKILSFDHTSFLLKWVIPLILLFVAIMLQTNNHSVFNTNKDLNVITSSIIVFSVLICPFFQKLLSLSPMIWLGDNSIAAFYLHWPLICSLSAFLFLKYRQYCEEVLLSIIICIITLILVFILSFLISKYLLPRCDNLSKKLAEKI